MNFSMLLDINALKQLISMHEWPQCIYLQNEVKSQGMFI